MLRPSSLKIGSKVAITASSSTVATEDIQAGIKILKSWGIELVLGKTLGTAYHNFSANDSDRKNELQSFIDDSSIDALLFARGGYGITRIIDNIDFTTLKEKPKWLIGFSDITAIHLHLQSIGIESIHGPMLKTMDFHEESNTFLKNLLFSKSPQQVYNFNSDINNRTGKAEGKALGGNLCLICHCLGTASEPDFTDAILFIEDIGEYAYALDRYLVQLARVGVFSKIKGIVVGDFSDTKETLKPFGSSVERCVIDHTEKYQLPVAFGFAFGHEKINYPIIMGADYSLKVEKNKAFLQIK
jgi:muramoyltetrapeptide carboxypeptidase